MNVINFLEQQPQWKSTLVIIAYDDSDGWYDHQMSPIMNQSTTSMDALTGPGPAAMARARCPASQRELPTRKGAAATDPDCHSW